MQTKNLKSGQLIALRTAPPTISSLPLGSSFWDFDWIICLQDCEYLDTRPGSYFVGILGVASGHCAGSNVWIFFSKPSSAKIVYFFKFLDLTKDHFYKFYKLYFHNYIWSTFLLTVPPLVIFTYIFNFFVSSKNLKSTRLLFLFAASEIASSNQDFILSPKWPQIVKIFNILSRTR